MVFKLEEMTLENEQFVFSEQGKKLTTGFGVVKRGVFESWVVDRERNFYIYHLRCSDPRDPRVNYIFSLDGELAIIKLNKPSSLDVIATLHYLPETLRGRETEIQSLFEEGFQVGAPEFMRYESQFGRVQMVFAPQGEGK